MPPATDNRSTYVSAHSAAHCVRGNHAHSAAAVCHAFLLPSRSKCERLLLDKGLRLPLCVSVTKRKIITFFTTSYKVKFYHPL